MKALTIRNVDTGLSRALTREVKRRGESVNATVLSLLRQALAVDDAGMTKSNGLAKLAGGWSDDDVADFERVTADFARVDDELWR